MQTHIKPGIDARTVYKIKPRRCGSITMGFYTIMTGYRQWNKSCFSCGCQYGIFCKFRHYGAIINTTWRNNSEENNNIRALSNKFVLHHVIHKIIFITQQMQCATQSGMSTAAICWRVKPESSCPVPILGNTVSFSSSFSCCDHSYIG